MLKEFANHVQCCATVVRIIKLVRNVLGVLYKMENAEFLIPIKIRRLS